MEWKLWWIGKNSDTLWRQRTELHTYFHGIFRSIIMFFELTNLDAMLSSRVVLHSCRYLKLFVSALKRISALNDLHGDSIRDG